MESEAIEEPEDALSWAEAWSILDVDPDEMLSVTQARLLADAYNLEKSLDDAVADGDLTEVQKRGLEHDGRSMQIHAGYRLIGEPEEDPEV